MVDTRLKVLEDGQSGLAREVSDVKTAMDNQNKLMQALLSQMSNIGARMHDSMGGPSQQHPSEVVISQGSGTSGPVSLRHKLAVVELYRFSGDNLDD